METRRHATARVSKRWPCAWRCRPVRRATGMAPGMNVSGATVRGVRWCFRFACAHSLRFLSTREYQEGDRLLVSFELTASAPWPTASETAARVLRIQAVPDSAALAVTIVREA